MSTPSDYHHSGQGSQVNSDGGAQNLSEGSGNHFPGSTIDTLNIGVREKAIDPEAEFLNSLAFPEMNSRADAIEDADPGTCKWLFDHEVYKKWSQDDDGLLLIKGKPGSGKSNLMRFLLSEVAQRSANLNEPLVLSYFFHGRGSDLQKSPLGLFRALLHQLLSCAPKILNDMVGEHQKRGHVRDHGESWQWSYDQLKRLFKDSLRKVATTRPIWLLIDALDECASVTAAKLDDDLQSIITTFPATSNIRFIVSCRRFPRLLRNARHEIFIDHQNAGDIQRYVQNRLTQELQETSIPTLITERAQGVFMWVRFVLRRIVQLDKDGVAIGIIEDTINNIPSELEDLYRNLIQRVEDKKASLKLFEWVCFAVRPLSLDELKWALHTDPDRSYSSVKDIEHTKEFISESERLKRRIETLSCGLIEFGEVHDSPYPVGFEQVRSFQVVQFIHQSVKEFFLSEGLVILDRPRLNMKLFRLLVRDNLYLFPPAGLETGPPTSHKSILWRTVQAMLTFITFGGLILQTIYPEIVIAPFTLFPLCLVGILAIGWQSPFLKDAQTKHVMGKAHDRISRVCFRFLVVNGLGLSTLQDLYEMRNTFRFRFLFYATTCWRYHSLEGDANMTFQEYVDKYFSSGTSLDLTQWARLLQMFNGLPYMSPNNATTPLHVAARFGLSGQLFDTPHKDQNHIDIESKDEWGRTALLCAAEGGHKSIVQLLLDRGANIEAEDEWGRTPLWYAAGAHDFLLPGQLDIFQESTASIERYGAVVRLLLSRGAKVDARDDRDCTPLLSATAVTSSLSVVTAGRQDPRWNEVGDPLGDPSPVREAMRDKRLRSNMAFQQFLFDTRLRGRMQPTYDSYKEIIQLLLENGATVGAKDKDGMTPLLHATKYFSDESGIAKLLHSYQQITVRQPDKSPGPVRARNLAYTSNA